MSIHLFNAEIDMALAQLDPEVGTEVGGVRVNHGAFADDIALYAVMLAGLQALTDDLNHLLGLCGLEISTSLAGKSASLRIDVDGKEEDGSGWSIHFPTLTTGNGEPGGRFIQKIFCT